MPKKRNEIIHCEKCNEVSAVVIHKHNYYCADCYIFLLGLPVKKMRFIDETNCSRRKQ